MSELTVLHNPRCSTSRAAMDQVGAAAVNADVVEYLKTPLDGAGLRELIAKLEDPATDLVRRDALDNGSIDVDGDGWSPYTNNCCEYS